MAGPVVNDDARAWSLTTFSADVTIPIGHPCMGGGIAPARSVVDPLDAIGFVLRGGGLDRPVVLVAVDWCEIRGEAYDRWRDALAAVAGTDRRHVLVTAIHQHDAPVIDLDAQRLLETHACRRGRLRPGISRTDRACAWPRRSEAAWNVRARPVTHLGMGAAKVDRVASNRRYRAGRRNDLATTGRALPATPRPTTRRRARSTPGSRHSASGTARSRCWPSATTPCTR